MTHHRLDPKSYFISRRSMVATYYLILRDGKFIFISSSTGNEGFMLPAYDAFIARTGFDATSNVVTNLVINFINIKTVGSDVEAIHVNIMALIKSIPNMIVSNILDKKGMFLVMIVEFLKSK